MMRYSLLLAVSFMLVVPVEAEAWPWRKSSSYNRYFYPSYYFNQQAFVAARTSALVASAKSGMPLSVVMQQAAAAGVPVDGMLKELIRSGVVTPANLKAAVTAAAQWQPTKADSVVQVAMANGLAPADAVVAAIAGNPRAAGPAVQAALSNRQSPEEARKILNAAYTSALGQTNEITAAARRAGTSPDVIASAQPWNQPLAVSPTPSATTASPSNISVAPFSAPSAGGGGGGGVASPN